MQELIVAIIVVFAFWIVAKRYAPQPVTIFCYALLARCAKWLGWNGVENKFRKKTEAASSCASGCGKCGGCGDSGSTSHTKEKNISMPASLKRSGSSF